MVSILTQKPERQGISTIQRESLTQMGYYTRDPPSGYGATLSRPGGSLVLQEKL
jgi:hypothetical protein